MLIKECLRERKKKYILRVVYQMAPPPLRSYSEMTSFNYFKQLPRRDVTLELAAVS